MGEVLVVSWLRDNLELRRLPSEGTWQSDANPLGKYDLHLPTRTHRFEQGDSGGMLPQAFSELFSNVEITTPVWLLLPSSWIIKFQVKVPEIDDDELIRSHLLWEAQARLHGDVSRFHVLIPENTNTEFTTVQAIHSSALELLRDSAAKANLNITGISVEPEANTDYSFELPTDFREAVSIESGDDDVVKIKANVCSATVFSP